MESSTNPAVVPIEKCGIGSEPNQRGERVTSMKLLLTPLVFVVLLLAACGDTSSEVGTGSSADEPNTPSAVEPDGPTGGAVEPVDIPVAVPADEEVITDYEPVDGQLVSPTEVVINPDDDKELWVRFVGGAAPCTAANVVVLTETPDAIELELTVGITSDALVKSCLAGEFPLRVDVPLNESATGKSISWVQTDQGGNEPMQITPDLTTDDLLGLSEEEVAAIADENILDWRVIRVDGEWFAVTEDFRPGRLNVEFDDGVVTVVTLG